MASLKNNLFYIPLEDVESEHCALIVDKGLGKIKSIDSHKVELNNNRAVITASKPEALPEAIHAIRVMGYGVTTVKKIHPYI